MRATDGHNTGSISATTAAFELVGGKYGVSCTGSGYGTATLEILAGNGSTYLTALTAFSADGYATVDLPPGQYKVAVTSATVTVAITRIPAD